ncbi:hypothetical protein HT031_006842 [Scenedesmus sp. PABB004]|nr:hypothetical protein HT031_006842 [Scenedesmus sp. PABB004]
MLPLAAAQAARRWRGAVPLLLPAAAAAGRPASQAGPTVPPPDGQQRLCSTAPPERPAGHAWRQWAPGLQRSAAGAALEQTAPCRRALGAWPPPAPARQHQQRRGFRDARERQERQRAAAARDRGAAPAQPAAPGGAPPGASAARPERAAGSSFASLPNLMSLSRVASAPWAAYLVATQQWPAALALTAAAGATDWLDGALARRLGHTSKLGSYLDPLADKAFVCAVVGALGWQGLLPAWLAGLVVGRDAAQVAGMARYRLAMFGGTWPGAAAFFDVDGGAGSSGGGSGGSGGSSGSSSSGGSAGGGGDGGVRAAAVPGLPAIRPLLVSKVNTALVLLLVAGCMTQQWQGVPGGEALEALELAIAGTTAASGVAYAHLHWTGRLLAEDGPPPQGG